MTVRSVTGLLRRFAPRNDRESESHFIDSGY
jgi:hypothetical protein